MSHRFAGHTRSLLFIISSVIFQKKNRSGKSENYREETLKLPSAMVHPLRLSDVATRRASDRPSETLFVQDHTLIMDLRAKQTMKQTR